MRKEDNFPPSTGMKHILLFIFANLILITGVFSLYVSPRIQLISRVRDSIQRQEAAIATHTKLVLAYNYNLQQLQLLEDMRFLLNECEVTRMLSNIKNLTEINNLQVSHFAISEPVSFDTIELDRVTRTSIRIEGDGTIADILKFFYKTERTPANIVTSNIVWIDGYRARINIELTLLSA